MVEVDQRAVLVEHRQIDVADDRSERNPCHDHPAPTPAGSVCDYGFFQLTVQLKSA
jgi:hypothetical protein